MLEHIKSISSVVNQTPFSLSLAVTKLFQVINCNVRVIKIKANTFWRADEKKLMVIGPNLLRKFPPWETDKKMVDKTYHIIWDKESELNS
jgi:hypothetical protein